MVPYAGVDSNLALCLLQSRLQLQHIYHARFDVNPMPESTLSPCQDLGFGLRKSLRHAQLTIQTTKTHQQENFPALICHLCWSVQYIFAEGPGGSGARHRNCGKKSLMAKAHYLLLMCIVFYVCNKSMAWSQILSGLGRLKSALNMGF